VPQRILYGSQLKRYQTFFSTRPGAQKTTKQFAEQYAAQQSNKGSDQYVNEHRSSLQIRNDNQRQRTQPAPVRQNDSEKPIPISEPYPLWPIYRDYTSAHASDH
jgi:hypothetical protein